MVLRIIRVNLRKMFISFGVGNYQIIRIKRKHTAPLVTRTVNGVLSHRVVQEVHQHKLQKKNENRSSVTLTFRRQLRKIICIESK